MKPLNQQATKIFNLIVEGLKELGDHKKIDNAPGAFMALSVELIDQWPEGNIFSLAHYYEQNGDLMRDPDMTFLVSNGTFHGSKFIAGLVFPASYRQDGLGIDQQSLFYEDNNGIHSLRICKKWQADHAVFANTWMRNIKAQQHI